MTRPCVSFDYLVPVPGFAMTRRKGSHLVLAVHSTGYVAPVPAFRPARIATAKRAGLSQRGDEGRLDHDRPDDRLALR
jgi:hypothetical protein